MSQSKFLVAFAAVSFATLTLAAPSPVGMWSGHVHLTAGATATAQQKQGIAKLMTTMSKNKISLNLKADHTFVSDVSGQMPQAGHKTGTWSLKGSSLVLTADKKSQTFTMAPNAKKMSLTIPSRPGFSGEVVFDR